MYWANFLHFYQPFDQQADILEMIVNQSYRPIIKGLKENPKARLALNINGALTELFDKYGYRDLIEDLKILGERGQIEFTASAKYHAFLPFLDEKEIIRQIEANNKTNKFYLGEAYKPEGFFPPEMAYSEKIGRIIDKLGYKWIILDEIACNGQIEQIDYHKLYKIVDTQLDVYFRERRTSNMIMGGVVRSDKTLLEALKNDIADKRYLITAMDGETFGHHRPGLDKLLLDIYRSDKYNMVKISELKDYFKEIQEVRPLESTWASSPQDIERGVQFLSWNDPDNEIHRLQNEFTNWVLERVRNLDPSNHHYEELMEKMDVALASDHFWWASAKPWWSLEMIELGAYRLMNIINELPDVTEEEKERAQNYYQKIIATAFEWQRTGRIRRMAQEQRSVLRIPFKDRTDSEGFKNAVNLMREEMLKAADSQEYEKAILWRDGMTKLIEKNDIYDAEHIIDLLRLQIPPGEMEALIDKYKIDYQQIRSGQPEQRGA